MDQIEKIERIEHMERILDEAEAALICLRDAIERYRQVRPRLCELEAYYTSPQWLGDYDDDAMGKLPKGLKRGVLSEDAVYNLLRLQKEIEEEFKA